MFLTEIIEHFGALELTMLQVCQESRQILDLDQTWLLKLQWLFRHIELGVNN